MSFKSVKKQLQLKAVDCMTVYAVSMATDTNLMLELSDIRAAVIVFLITN